MEHTTTVFIADGAEDFCTGLTAALQRSGGFQVVGTAADGEQAIRGILQTKPDVLVLDLMLPKKDGLAAFQAIRSMTLPVEPAVMVLSGYLTPRIQEELCQLRPCFFSALPCDLQALTRRIQAGCQELAFRSTRRIIDADTERCRLLRELGLTMHCKGFSYIRYGLQLLAEKPNLGLGVTKWLYPAIAAHYQTTAVNVERAIRSAVIVAWQRKGYLLQHRLFRERPTNSELFAVAEEYLRQEQRMTGIR